MNRRQKQKKLKRIIPIVRARAFVLLSKKDVDFLQEHIDSIHKSKFDREFAPHISEYFVNSTFPMQLNKFFTRAENEILKELGITLKDAKALQAYLNPKEVKKS